MTPFSEWSVSLKFSSIGAALAALVVLGDAAGALEDLEPYTPSTRGFVRAAVMDITKVMQDERAGDLKTLKEEWQLVMDQTASQLRSVQTQQYDIQDTIYAGQLRSLRAELIDMELRLREAPTDRMILQRKAEIEAEISTITTAKRGTQCAKLRVQGFSSQC